MTGAELAFYIKSNGLEQEHVVIATPNGRITLDMIDIDSDGTRLIIHAD